MRSRSVNWVNARSGARRLAAKLKAEPRGLRDEKVRDHGEGEKGDPLSRRNPRNRKLDSRGGGVARKAKSLESVSVEAVAPTPRKRTRIRTVREREIPRVSHESHEAHQVTEPFSHGIHGRHGNGVVLVREAFGDGPNLS